MERTMIEVFKKYSDFGRKAKRSEFWGVALSLFGLGFLVTVTCILLMLGGWLGSIIAIPALLVFMVLSTWVSIATIVARCRDAGINPWFTAACFVPYIGTIVFIVIGCIGTKNE